jgi:hypothetical protein
MHTKAELWIEFEKKVVAVVVVFHWTLMSLFLWFLFTDYVNAVFSLAELLLLEASQATKTKWSIFLKQLHNDRKAILINYGKSGDNPTYIGFHCFPIFVVKLECLLHDKKYINDETVKTNCKNGKYPFFWRKKFGRIYSASFLCVTVYNRVLKHLARANLIKKLLNCNQICFILWAMLVNSGTGNVSPWWILIRNSLLYNDHHLNNL